MIKTILPTISILLLLSGYTYFTVRHFQEVPPPLPPSTIFVPVEGNSNWLKIVAGVRLDAATIVARHKTGLGLSQSDELVLIRTDKDDLGFSHHRYQHFHQGVKVQGSQLIVHEKEGAVQTLNGRLVRGLRADVRPLLSGPDAIDRALVHLPAMRYMWESEAAESLLKKLKRNPLATFFPQPELVLMEPGFGQDPDEYRLAYSLTVHALLPEKRVWLFVDAQTGEVIHSLDNLQCQATNHHGTAETKYHGTRPIITDSVGMDSFRLYETTRGRGIHTLNIRRATDISFAVDFFDSDNYWNNVNNNQDEAATDAHWGAEMTFDYFLHQHDHLGIDGDSMELIGFVHYGQDVTNAFWNGAYASFGDGGTNATPLTALDVVGHEFTHGITDFTSNLIYQNESGALNESFSDIFGTALEFWADTATGDWEIGEDFLTEPFRDMADPNRFGHPDTYFGTSWFTASGDNGGVHTNSGVQNHWFFLLTEGGLDTNDIGNPFEVIGLGMDKAAQVAFRNLKYYLTESSRYQDARLGAIQAAIDLFGNCSFEMKQVVAAWHAVGVGAINPMKDIGVVAVSGVEDFKCGVSEEEVISLKFVFSDCDSNLLPGTKVPVYFQVDGGPQTWDTLLVVNEITYSDTLSFTFSMPVAQLALPGTYTLQAGVVFPGDNTPENNARTWTVERIYDQNIDLAAADLPLPLPGCLLSNETVAVEIGFEGCEFIPAGEMLDVSYQVDGGPIFTETIAIPFDLFRGQTFVHTFGQTADLSAIQNHRLDAWATYSADTLTANNALPALFVVNPVLMQLADFISFEAGMPSLDSFYFLTGAETRAFISEKAKRDGQFGFQVTGGDVVRAFFNNEITIPEVTTVWDINPQFRSRICFCADLTGLANADFKFRMKQTFSELYKLDFGFNTNTVCAARVLINENPVGNTFFPLGHSASPYFLRTYNLANYLGGFAEVCIETSTFLGEALDPYGIGDNVFIDNVTIEGTPTAVYSPLLPEGAMAIYPNPGTGQFMVTFEVPAPISGQLVVTDAQGKTVLKRPANLASGKNELPLRLEAAVPGTYFVTLVSEGKKSVRKVVLH